MQRAHKRALQIRFKDDYDEDEFTIIVDRRPRWIWERAEDFETLDDRGIITSYRL